MKVPIGKKLSGDHKMKYAITDYDLEVKYLILGCKVIICTSSDSDYFYVYKIWFETGFANFVFFCYLLHILIGKRKGKMITSLSYICRQKSTHRCNKTLRLCLGNMVWVWIGLLCIFWYGGMCLVNNLLYVMHSNFKI